MEDLEEVITFHREALTFRPPGHPDRSQSLNNLAIAVLTRYKHSWPPRSVPGPQEPIAVLTRYK